MIQGHMKLSDLSSFANKHNKHKYDPYDNTFYYPDILVKQIFSHINAVNKSSTDVEVQKSIINDTLLQKLDETGCIIEYIDAEETDTCMIAMYPNQ